MAKTSKNLAKKVEFTEESVHFQEMKFVCDRLLKAGMNYSCIEHYVSWFSQTYNDPKNQENASQYLDLVRKDLLHKADHSFQISP